MSPKEINRREMVRALGLMGSASLLGCAGDSTGTTDDNGARLADLSLSTGTLSPAFSAATTTYTVSVPNGASSLTVTAQVATPGATIRINGSAVNNGAVSGDIALAVGTNTIPIVVTAADGTTTRTYTVVVSRATVSGASCVLIPQETDGPFPLYAFLANSAVRRQDIREGKTGVPLTLTLTLVNVNSSCAPISNAAVYIWSCDKDGAYSGYSGNGNGSHAGETFLRGVQTTNANGEVTFTTIFPGWYAGRITHIHFEVFLQNNLGANAKAISQLAFPQAVTQAVYSSPLYATHGQNTSVASFAQDNVFSDGTQFQLANISGNVSDGYVAMLTVGVAV